MGVVWSAWHAPLFLMDATTQASASVPWFTLQAVGLSVVLAWAVNSTGGSVLLAVLAHAALNAWYSTAVQGLAPEALAIHTPYAAALVAAGALVVVWRFGPADLSRRERFRA